MSNYQKLLKDTGGNISHTPNVDGVNVLPTAATVTILDNSGANLTTAVTAANMTIANDGKLTYTVTAGNTDKQANGYQAEIKFTYSSVVYVRNIYYDVVLATFYITVEENDIYNELPILRNMDIGEINMDEMIERVFVNHLERDIRNRGRLTHLQSRSIDYKLAHIYKTIEVIANNFTEDEGGKWDMQRRRYEELYTKELEFGVFAQDVDDNNRLSEGENLLSSRKTRLIR